MVRQTEDHILYAHWTQDYISLLSFGFANSGGDFGYKTGYRIPYSRYQLIYGNTALAKQMYEWSGPWGGSCGGMAALSGLFYLPDTGLDFQDFRKGPSDANVPSQLSNIRPDYRSNEYSTHQRDLSLRGLVEAMQLDQGCCLSSRGLGHSLNNLWDAVDSFYKTGENPVRISVRGPSGGHALVGYRVETVSDTEGRIYVYDCNAPLSQNEYITLKKETPRGEYTTWSYYEYDKSIAFYINNGRVPSWLSKTEKSARAAETLDTVDPTMELLLVNSDQAEVRNSSGQVVATVTDGTAQAEQSGVYPVNIVSELAPEPADSEFTAPTEDTNIKAVWVPVGQYTVENKDDSMSEEFQATMVHVEQAATITTSGDMVSFIVDDGTDSSAPVNYVRLGDPNATYEICLETSDVSGENHYKEIRMSGQSTGEAVSFAQAGDGLYMDGAPVEQTKYEIRLDGDRYADIDLETYEGDITNYEVPSYSETTPWMNTTAAEVQVQEKMPESLSAVVVNCSVTFDPNGGTGTMAAKNAVKGMPLVLPACSFTPPVGKTFDRWAVGTVNGQQATAGDFCTITEDTIIYALWKDNGSDSGSSSNGSSSSGRSITVKNSANGSINLSSTRAVKGASVTVTVRPDAGYVLDTLTILDSKGNRITLTEKDGRYSFIMPEGSVSVEATFRPQNGEDSIWTNPFGDVETGAWYYDAVKYVNQKQLMNGMENGLFQPKAPLSRAMMAQILYNRAGRPSADTSVSFSDVGTGTWYATAVSWAKENGLVTGYEDGTFQPNQALTREQFAVILWRYAGGLSTDGDLSRFSDSDEVSTFAVEAVRWASSNDILMGSDGKIDPKGIAQRAHVAAMLMRYLETIAE